MLRLKQGVYASIAADPAATMQGLAVFVIAAAIGSIWLDSMIPALWAAGLLAIGVASILLRVVSKLFSSATPGPRAWFRTLLFASTPMAVAFGPVIGRFVAFGYTVMIVVATVRELAQVSLGRAVLVVLVAVAVSYALLVALGTAALFAGIWLLAELLGRACANFATPNAQSLILGIVSL